MTVLTEKTLQFTFSDDCEAIKFDDHTFYRPRFSDKNHKGMDILAIHKNRHWWIEIKDCEGYEDDNKSRISLSETEELITARDWLSNENSKMQNSVKVARKKPFIIDEIIEKLRDTLVCLNFAKYENESSLSLYSNWFDSKQPPIVVLFLTWNINDFKRIAKFLTQKLNTALLPYGLEGIVVNEHERTGLNYTVSRIAS